MKRILATLFLCAAASGAIAQTTMFPDGWSLLDQHDHMTDAHTVMLIQPSKTPNETDNALVLRCAQRQWHVLLIPETAVSWNLVTAVTSRVDQAPPVVENWTPAANHQSAQSPQPEAFINRIAGGRDLWLAYADIFDRRHEFEINLSGLQLHLQQANAACAVP